MRMSRKWRHDPRNCGYRAYSQEKVRMTCEFCGDEFFEKGNSKVLCPCGRDHAICYDCVKKYATTKNIDHFRWHSVSVCPDKGLKVARALMGEEPIPIYKKELKW